MTRGQVLAVFASPAAAVLFGRPARADGLIRFYNGSFARGVVVEVRVGATLDGATLYGTQKIARGDVWEVDTAGSVAWWRRETNPGSNDGRTTGWQRVDPDHTDARVRL
ncbi:MAG: hypothetical protein JO225_14595 [Candidatus Eremiobacteraeota bacterium]|nr:hypothetical protein [Candidatus Eremiobacteraeota bacterium]MBV8645134.1 hypothetical protein [Candidatus Eremiobacteraeota bacterium]